MRLSVLDQAPISEGSTAAEALHRSVDLGRHVEALGYRRYWVAEHHGTPSLACAAPEVLIGAIADATERIRVGSGGVMLPHYSPLKVADVFSMLSGLHPERIDLGIGRAPGTDPMTTMALQRDRTRPTPDDFIEQLVELLALLEDRMPENHPFARLSRSLPGRPERPEPWLLGSSPQSAIWAAELGLPYSFADFINPNGPAIAADYRGRFVDSERLGAPLVMAAVVAICAETDEEAERVASSMKMMFSLLRQGTLVQVPPVEKALAYLETRSRGPGSGRRAVIGSPATVRAGLEEVAGEYGADELMLLTTTFDHGARRRSYELIAEEFGLAGAGDGSGAGPHCKRLKRREAAHDERLQDDPDRADRRRRRGAGRGEHERAERPERVCGGDVGGGQARYDRPRCHEPHRRGEQDEERSHRPRQLRRYAEQILERVREREIGDPARARHNGVELQYESEVGHASQDRSARSARRLRRR